MIAVSKPVSPSESTGPKRRSKGFGMNGAESGNAPLVNQARVTPSDCGCGTYLGDDDRHRITRTLGGVPKIENAGGECERGPYPGASAYCASRTCGQFFETFQRECGQ